MKIFRVLLFVRGAASLAFGGALAGWWPGNPAQSYVLAGMYAATDGLIGFAIGFGLLFLPMGRSLALLTMIDAAARMLLGIIVLNTFALTQTVFGSTLFFTLVIFTCSVVGVGSVAYLCLLRFFVTPSIDQRPVQFWPGIALGTFTAMLGAGFAVDVSDIRKVYLLASYALALGVVFVVSAIRLSSSARGRIAG